MRHAGSGAGLCGQYRSHHRMGLQELEKRHIKVASTMFTNLPRVLACGDICTYEGRVPLIAVGFGEAATAVNNAAHLIDPSLGLSPGHSSGGSAE